MLDPAAPAAAEGAAPAGATAEAPAPAPAAPASFDPFGGLNSKPLDEIAGLPGVYVPSDQRSRDNADIPDDKPLSTPSPLDPNPGATAAAAAVGSGSPGSESQAAPKPQLFEIADMQFESREAAAHYLRTIRGRASAADARNQEARLRQLELEREIEQLKRSKPASESPEPPSPQAAKPAAGTAPASPGERRRVAANIRTLYGDEAADAYLDERAQEDIAAAVARATENLSKQFEEKLKPLSEITAMRENTVKAHQVVQTLRTYQNPDGSPAYPELADGQEATAAEIRDLWMKMGFAPAELLTNRGLHSAIANYRDAKARRALAMARPANPARQRPAPPLPPVSPTAGHAPARGARPAATDKDSELLDAIDKASLNQHGYFGFQVR